jgi:hypothetical protein
MIKIRQATENDKEGWNRVAYASPEATYAHTWEWKEIIEEELGVETLYLVADNGSELIGIYPAYIRPTIIDRNIVKTILKSVNIAWSPLDLTWDYGGPCTLPNQDKSVIEQLIVGMEKFATKRNCISIRTSMFKYEDCDSFFLQENYRKSPRQTFILDLSLDEGILWNNIAKRARKYINVGKKHNIIIREVWDEAGIRDVYNCILHTHSRVGAYTPPYTFFLKVNEKLGKAKLSRFRIALLGDKVIGGDLLFCFNNMVVERYRGIYDDYLDMRTNYLMVWTAIEESKKQGYKVYDQGGASEEAEGIFFFKSRWHGQLINTDWYVKNLRFDSIRKLLQK